MECNRCLLTDEVTTIVNGECEFCRIHDKLESDKTDINKVFKKIRKRKGFQVLIGISGGVDSSYLLHLALKEGIRPLVVHFDNGYNNPVAESNMKKLVKDVTFIRYSLPETEYKELNKAFLKAGVSEADIPNDMAMTAIMMDIADKYNIKYILNGHDFRNEGSTPLCWTYMDAKYVQSVYKKYTGKKLIHFPLFTFKKQLIYALKGIKQIRPYNYIAIRDNAKKKELRRVYGWRAYGPKHSENYYTEWVGYYYLPNYFSIDKRIIYLSAQIRSGYITKEKARLKLLETHTIKMMFEVPERINRTYKAFETYNFKRYKPLLWILAKLKLIPYLFYKKYT